MTPETRYARTADGTHVTNQVNGDGPIDLVGTNPDEAAGNSV